MSFPENIQQAADSCASTLEGFESSYNSCFNCQVTFTWQILWNSWFRLDNCKVFFDWVQVNFTVSDQSLNSQDYQALLILSGHCMIFVLLWLGLHLFYKSFS